MRCRLLLVLHLVAILSTRQSRPAAAAGAPRTPDSMSRWCADASMEDVMETSEACQKAETLGGVGAECRAYVDAVLQLCLEEAAVAGHLERQSPFDGLKRNRNKFLGKRGAWKRESGSRNNFLGKRETAGLFRNIMDTMSGEQLAAEDAGDKRSRNKFLGKRAELGAGGVQLQPTSYEKKSRNNFLGKRDDEYLDELSRLMTIDDSSEEDKRSRDRFLGKREHQSDIKRSRNKFLGKREVQPISSLEGTHL